MKDMRAWFDEEGHIHTEYNNLSLEDSSDLLGASIAHVLGNLGTKGGAESYKQITMVFIADVIAAASVIMDSKRQAKQNPVGDE